MCKRLDRGFLPISRGLHCAHKLLWRRHIRRIAGSSLGAVVHYLAKQVADRDLKILRWLFSITKIYTITLYKLFAI